MLLHRGALDSPGKPWSRRQWRHNQLFPVAKLTPFFHQHLESGRKCNQSPPLGLAHVTQARQSPLLAHRSSIHDSSASRLRTVTHIAFSHCGHLVVFNIFLLQVKIIAIPLSYLVLMPSSLFMSLVRNTLLFSVTQLRVKRKCAGDQEPYTRDAALLGLFA